MVARKLFNAIFNLNPYPLPTERNRAWIVYTLTTLVVAFYSFYALTVPQWTVNGRQYTLWGAAFANNFSGLDSLLFLGFYVLAFVAIWITGRGNVTTGAWLLVGAWYVGGVWFTIQAGGQLISVTLGIVQMVLLAALVRELRGVVISTILGMVTLVGVWLLRGGDGSIFTLILLEMNILASSAVLWLFLRFFRLSVSTGVTSAVANNRKIDQIVETATMGAEQRLPSTQLIQESLKQLAVEFPFIQNARVFLIEDAEAVLFVDSGQIEITPQKQTRYGIGGLSTIGQVTLQAEPSLSAREGSRVLEAVLPMRIASAGSSRVVGALDLRVDIRRGNPLEQQETVNLLQTLADRLAQIVDNLRRFEQLEQQVRERETKIEQQVEQMLELDRLNQRMTSSVWSQYVRDIEQEAGLSVDFQQDTVQPNADWTRTLSEARRSNHIVQEQHNDTQVIAVPLRVRGQVVGAMEFEIDTSRGFSPEDLELLQEVSERFGLAAENSRLLDDSRRVAQREALVNQIATRLQSTSSVNATLLEAARSLREAVKANKVAIRLGKPGHGEVS